MKRMFSDDFAVYLPAVNETYANFLSKAIPNERPFSDAFTLNDLMFWKGNSKLFYHPHYLHSVGNYKIGSNPSNVITQRGISDGTLFGDSGGYQIGTGKLKGIDTLKANMDGDAACLAWREAYEARFWMLNFLETHTNYAMTIDMPLWATTRPNTPFCNCTPKQLTDLTIENLKFIDSHRLGYTKWLNVIQGSDVATMKNWWDEVKWFKGSGYSLSSIICRRHGIAGILELLLIMRDAKAFDEGNDWLHILGISTARWAIVFTALQHGLQATANSKLRISYDSASPYLDAGERDLMAFVPDLDANTKSWNIQTEQIPQSRKFLNDPTELSQFTSPSPIAKLIKLGHLNVNDEYGMDTRRQLDTLASVLIANHNVWVYLETFKQANELTFVSNSNRVPSIYKECLESIKYLFTVEDWASELIKEKPTLDRFK